MAAIDSDYPKSQSSGFATVYMRQLFEYGYQKGQSGQLWQAPQLELQGATTARSKVVTVATP